MTSAFAIAGIVIAGASAGYAAHATNKANKAKQSAIDQSLSNDEQFREAYGGVPEAAPYKPVSFTSQQRDTILGNQENLDEIRTLTRGTNNFITNDALRRINKLMPNYNAGMLQYGKNTNALLSGELPFDDVQRIIGDRAEMTGSMDVPGSAGPATLRDLGISRLDAMKTGGGMMQDMVRIAETVSPRASYARPQDMMLSPSQTVPWALDQAQTVQQSDQLEKNLAATGDPAIRAQMLAQQAATAAAPIPVDVGAAAGQAAGGVAQGYLKEAFSAKLQQQGGNGSPSGGYVKGYDYTPQGGYSAY